MLTEILDIFFLDHNKYCFHLLVYISRSCCLSNLFCYNFLRFVLIRLSMPIPQFTFFVFSVIFCWPSWGLSPSWWVWRRCYLNKHRWAPNIDKTIPWSLPIMMHYSFNTNLFLLIICFTFFNVLKISIPIKENNVLIQAKLLTLVNM